LEVEMRKVVVFTNLSLDGVMQAPALPDEDLRGDFRHGGWEDHPGQGRGGGVSMSGG
jgi:hypothetical protein